MSFYSFYAASGGRTSFSLLTEQEISLDYTFTSFCNFEFRWKTGTSVLKYWSQLVFASWQQHCSEGQGLLTGGSARVQDRNTVVVATVTVEHSQQYVTVNLSIPLRPARVVCVTQLAPDFDTWLTFFHLLFPIMPERMLLILTICVCKFTYIFFCIKVIYIPVYIFLVQ